jgi:hypothetical protein
LEALIWAALQLDELSSYDRGVIQRRAEKDGEDWAEVEMIIRARKAAYSKTKL